MCVTKGQSPGRKVQQISMAFPCHTSDSFNLILGLNCSNFDTEIGEASEILSQGISEFTPSDSNTHTTMLMSVSDNSGCSITGRDSALNDLELVYEGDPDYSIA